MKCQSKKIFTISGFLLSMLFTGAATAQLWEIPDPQLEDIAKIRAAPSGGSTVVYNPDTCREIGAACGFFRKHAHAHAHLNHLLLPPSAYPALTEAKADCWVAKNGNSEIVLAAFEFFQNIDSYPNVKVQGDPEARAQKVRNCAIEAGNWIGNDY